MWQEQVEGLGVFSLQGLTEDPALVCTGHILGLLCGRDPWSRRGVCTQPAPASPGTLAGMPVLGPCMHLPIRASGLAGGSSRCPRGCGACAGPGTPWGLTAEALECEGESGPRPAPGPGRPTLHRPGPKRVFVRPLSCCAEMNVGVIVAHTGARFQTLRDGAQSVTSHPRRTRTHTHMHTHGVCSVHILRLSCVQLSHFGKHLWGRTARSRPPCPQRLHHRGRESWEWKVFIQTLDSCH